MEPSIKLLVPRMNKGLQSTVIKLLASLLSTGCLSCQKKGSKTKGELKEANEMGKRALRGERWWRSK